MKDNLATEFDGEGQKVFLIIATAYSVFSEIILGSNVRTQV
jgi:hypothetical protein